METNNKRSALVFGALLITIGALLLAGQLFDFLNWGSFWPLINVGIGLLFFVGMFLGGKATGPLAIPGAIFITVGLVLFFQNFTGAWETWSYAWGLIVAAVGIGLYIYGVWSDQPGSKEAGWAVIRTGLTLFLVFGLIFELVFSIFHISSRPVTLFFPLALVLVGILLFVLRVFRMATASNKLSHDDRDLFWPVIFIGVGLIWVLVFIGRVPSSQALGLLNLWPALLIVIGLDLLTGRRYPWVGALLGVLVVVGLFFALFRADSLGLTNRLPFGSLIKSADQYPGETVTVNGSGILATENRPVSGFDRLRLTGIGEVEITQGASESMEIETDDNILPYITSEVRGSELVIGLKPGTRLGSVQQLRFRVMVKDLEKIIIAGAGKVSVANLTTDRLEVESPGAGGLKINGLEVDRLFVDLSGAGSIETSGTVQALDVKITGAGSYQGADLRSQDANVSITGLGSATLWVTDNLDVDISGAGSVNYYGDPKVDRVIKGLGSLNNLGQK